MRVLVEGSGGAAGWPQPGCRCASCLRVGESIRVRSTIVVDDALRLGVEGAGVGDAGAGVGDAGAGVGDAGAGVGDAGAGVGDAGAGAGTGAWGGDTGGGGAGDTGCWRWLTHMAGRKPGAGT